MSQRASLSRAATACLLALVAVPSAAAEWVQLGGQLNPDPVAFVPRPSLVGHPRADPILAFSASDPATYLASTRVLHWAGEGWAPVGPAIEGYGPSLGLDGHGRPFVCTGAGGPFVRTWRGQSWVPVGGDISAETGYQGYRYSVDACGGIVLDGSGAPIVGWSADVGAKANVVQAARWDHRQRLWMGLGPDPIGGRATDVSIAIDEDDRPWVATFTPGGSYGGGATTRVFRWEDAGWVQLGADLPGTDGPAIAVREGTGFLALQELATGAIRITTWHRVGPWVDLPSPGVGMNPVLDFTSSGTPVVAFQEWVGGATYLVAKAFVRGAWQAIGDPIADVTGNLVFLALAVGGDDRPTVACSATDPSAFTNAVVAWRWSDPLAW